MSKDFKVFLGVISFFVLLKGYIFFNINPSMYLNPMGFYTLSKLIKKMRENLKFWITNNWGFRQMFKTLDSI